MVTISDKTNGQTFQWQKHIIPLLIWSGSKGINMQITSTNITEWHISISTGSKNHTQGDQFPNSKGQRSRDDEHTSPHLFGSGLSFVG